MLIDFNYQQLKINYQLQTQKSSICTFEEQNAGHCEQCNFLCLMNCIKLVIIQNFVHNNTALNKL